MPIQVNYNNNNNNIVYYGINLNYILNKYIRELH